MDLETARAIAAVLLFHDKTRLRMQLSGQFSACGERDEDLHALVASGWHNLAGAVWKVEKR